MVIMQNMYAAGSCRGAWLGRCTTCRLMRRPLGSSGARVAYRRWLCCWGEGLVGMLLDVWNAYFLHTRCTCMCRTGPLRVELFSCLTSCTRVTCGLWPPRQQLLTALQGKMLALPWSPVRTLAYYANVSAIPLHPPAWACAWHQRAQCSACRPTSEAARQRKLLTHASPRPAASPFTSCSLSSGNNRPGRLRGARAGRRRVRCRTCRAKLRAARPSASWAPCRRWRACCPARTPRSAAGSSLLHASYMRIKI